MKKNLVLLLACMSTLSALTATITMPAMYNKNDTYPQSGEEAAGMITHLRACLIEKGEDVRRIDSSFSLLKVRTIDSRCAGWAPKEFFKY